jgi:hypothetical protein
MNRLPKVDEGVNELSGREFFPSSAEEGQAVRIKKSREATLARADGVVLAKEIIIFDQHHPVRSQIGGFAIFS